MNTVNLPRQIVNKIMTLAQTKERQEICGLISKTSDNKMKLLPISNTAKEPSHFFEMDPAETIQAMKTMREENSELFAIYHSHPDTPAYPSKTDIERAGYPNAVYLIISLNTKGVLELKGFKIVKNTVSQLDLAV